LADRARDRRVLRSALLGDRVALSARDAGAGPRSALAKLVAARLDAVDEHLLPLLEVGPPVEEILADPSRDESEIPLGLAPRQAVAIHHVEHDARGVGGRGGRSQPYGLRRRAHLRRRLVPGGDQAGREAGAGCGGPLGPLVAPLAVGLDLRSTLLL